MNEKKTFGEGNANRQEMTKAVTERRNDKMKGPTANTTHSDNRAADASLTAGLTFKPQQEAAVCGWPRCVSSKG